jgi:hypothetical protein
VRRIPPGKEKSTVLRGLLIIVPSFAIIGFAQTKVLIPDLKAIFRTIFSA